VHSLPRPFPCPKNQSSAPHLEFVSSRKNHFGGKWLDVVYAVEGNICALYFLAPFCVPKVSLPLNLKLCFVLEGSRKVVHFWVPIWVFALLQNSQVATLASFRPSPTRHSLPDSWNVREILGVVVCPIGPGFSQSLRFWGLHALGMCLPAWISAPSRSVSVRNPT